jgi:outer membrane lipoprotein-sorting protein
MARPVINIGNMITEHKDRQSKRMRLLLFIAACTTSTACFAQTATPAPNAEGEPRAIFQRLKGVAGSNSLEFQTSYAVVSETRAGGSVHFQIKRPNLFRIEGTAGRENYVLVSDGKSMIIYNAGEGRYTEVPAPASAADGLGLLVGLASTQSQLLGLVGVIREVSSGDAGTRVASAGADQVDGRQCKRFSIVRNADSWWPENWEVWLEDEDLPLPCKFKVTTTDSLARDVQTNQFAWRADPAFTDETFQFTPPKDSVKVDSVGGLGLHPPTN